MPKFTHIMSALIIIAQMSTICGMDRATKKFYKTHVPEIPSFVINAINRGDKNRVATFLESNLFAYRARAIKENYNTLLMYAARTGNIGMIELCIVAGTGINRTNSDGWTPLTFAAKHGHLQAVEFLVSTGADINIRQIQAKRCLN